MKARKGETHIVRDFATWSDYVRSAESGANKMGTSHLNEDSFAACSFANAIKFARMGWDEGVNDITMLATPIFKTLSSRIPKRRVGMDIIGHQVIVGRYLAGAPDHMQRFKPTKSLQFGKGRKQLHIMYNQATSGSVSLDVMRSRGATVAALVQLLEYAGFVVDVTLVEGIRGFNYTKNQTFSMRVPLKKSGTVTDVSRLAFGLSHPACLRRLSFGLHEGEPDFQSHGAPMDIMESTEWFKEGDLYIGPALNGKVQWTDPDAARNWIVDQIQAQGVDLR